MQRSVFSAAVAKIGIIGASGYAGAELLRLCAAHPELEVAWATGDRQAGSPVAGLYPNLAAQVGAMVFETFEPGLVDGTDAVFLALPHGASSTLVPDLVGRTGAILDLAADFRLRDAALYPQWYGEAHPAPGLLGEFVYGLPELFRDQLVGATKVAVPGCYPTTAAVALAPLLRAGLVEPTGIIVDAASGVSGAGRDKHPFCATDENFQAYGLLDHRHTPEIEQALDSCVAAHQPRAEVLFTPHLVPMNRGILATCYARPTGATSTAAVLDVLRDAYAGEPFVVVSEQPPQTKATTGSNCVHVTARYDERTGWVVALGALDNLVKGAAGQAVQCANIVLGLPEATGLSTAGMYP
jgi:N-acetyl-gamma-glutamyl-phosphate reductase